MIQKYNGILSRTLNQNMAINDDLLTSYGHA